MISRVAALFYMSSIQQKLYTFKEKRKYASYIEGTKSIKTIPEEAW